MALNRAQHTWAFLKAATSWALNSGTWGFVINVLFTREADGTEHVLEARDGSPIIMR